MAKDKVVKSKEGYVDHGWPKEVAAGHHIVTEMASVRAGALSPYGDVVFPVPAEELDYIHPITKINR